MPPRKHGNDTRPSGDRVPEGHLSDVEPIIATPAVQLAPIEALPEPPATAPAVLVENPDGTVSDDVADVGERTPSIFVLIRGERYEHVSDAPDGRWIYRRS